MDNEKLQVIPVHVLVFPAAAGVASFFGLGSAEMKKDPGQIFIRTNPMYWYKSFHL